MYNKGCEVTSCILTVKISLIKSEEQQFHSSPWSLEKQN